MKIRKSCKVRLYIRIRRTDGQYTYADPAWNKNRTLRGSYALVGGKAEAHPEGIYYLRYLRGRKRVWQSVGSSADAALATLRSKEHDLQAVALGRVASEPAQEDTPALTVAEAIDVYVVNIRRFRSKKTLAACTNILGAFAATYGTRPLASLRRDDLLDHTAALTDTGLAPRTVFNHVMRIKTFLRSQGITDLLKREDIPTYDEPEVEAYNTDEIDDLFQAAAPEERLLFEFFLNTGFRDQEVQFCTWRNVDFKGKVISVRSKPDLGFRPKDKEERSVPVPDTLIEALAQRKRSNKSPFIFSAKNGEHDGHFLRKLQSLALRAGLNCGECVNKQGKSCRNYPICSHWGLHKFRKTFATMHSEAGVPVTTIQRWLGHSDLATTLRYLAVADLRSDKTRQQVNATFANLASSPLPDADQANASRRTNSSPSHTTNSVSDEQYRISRPGIGMAASLRSANVHDTSTEELKKIPAHIPSLGPASGIHLQSPTPGDEVMLEPDRRTTDEKQLFVHKRSDDPPRKNPQHIVRMGQERTYPRGADGQ